MLEWNICTVVSFYNRPLAPTDNKPWLEKGKRRKKTNFDLKIILAHRSIMKANIYKKELEKVITKLYDTFSIYPLRYNIEACPCCVTEEEKN